MHQYHVVDLDAQPSPPPTPYIGENYTETCDNVVVLPPKSFIAQQLSTLERVLFQSSVGLGVLAFWGTIFFFWQWALNRRMAQKNDIFVDSFYYDDDTKWKPKFLLSTVSAYQPCDAASYSTLDPTFLVPGNFTHLNVTGNFTLSQVKAMDIAFNMVIGRGTQALLLFISYYVTTDILMRVTEYTPVRFDLFSALAFNHSSFPTALHVLRGVFNLRGWRAQLIMIWIFLSSIFLMVIPTLIDTMSGYAQNQRKDKQFRDGKTITLVTSDQSSNATEEHNNERGGFTWVCTPQEGYHWGLAEFWVSITIILLGVWSLGTFLVWIDAQHACELRRKGRGLDTFRAVVDLADAVHGVLGEEISGYSGMELRKAMERSPDVQYGVVVDERNGLERITLGVRRTRDLAKLSWNTVYG